MIIINYILSIITTFLGLAYSAVAFFVLDIPLSTKIITSLIALLIASLVTIAQLLITNKKRGDEIQKLNKEFEELKKNHKALATQFDKKKSLLDSYKKHWNILYDAIMLLKLGKISERVDEIQKIYLKINSSLSEEEQK